MRSQIMTLALLASLSINAFAANEGQTTQAVTTNNYNCRNLYEVAINTQVKTVHKNAVKSFLFGTGTKALGTGGLLIAGLASPVSLATAAGMVTVNGVGTVVALTAPTELEKVEKLEDHEKRQQRLAKQVSEETGVEVSTDDIVDAVAKGIDDGTFCQNYPDLYNTRDIKQYLIKKLQ